MTEQQDPNWSIDCPHCGHKHTDWQNYIDTDDMSGEFDENCEKCGKPYQAKYNTVITFSTKKVEDSGFSQAPIVNELLHAESKEEVERIFTMIDEGGPVYLEKVDLEDEKK